MSQGYAPDLKQMVSTQPYVRLKRSIAMVTLNPVTGKLVQVNPYNLSPHVVLSKKLTPMTISVDEIPPVAKTPIARTLHALGSF